MAEGHYAQQKKLEQKLKWKLIADVHQRECLLKSTPNNFTL